MPSVYLAVKYHPDHSNRDLIEAISIAFERAGIETVCVARDLEGWGETSFSADELMRRSFDAIRETDAVVVDLSEKGVGLGIEAGFATAIGHPVFVIHRQGTDVSTTLEGIAQAVYTYEDHAGLEPVAALMVREAPKLRSPGAPELSSD